MESDADQSVVSGQNIKVGENRRVTLKDRLKKIVGMNNTSKMGKEESKLL